MSMYNVCSDLSGQKEAVSMLELELDMWPDTWMLVIDSGSSQRVNFWTSVYYFDSLHVLSLIYWGAGTKIIDYF